MKECNLEKGPCHSRLYIDKQLTIFEKRIKELKWKEQIFNTLTQPAAPTYKIEPFSGEKSEDVKNFFIQFELGATLFQWYDVKKFENLPYYLMDDAMSKRYNRTY